MCNIFHQIFSLPPWGPIVALKSFLLTNLIFKEKVSALLDWGRLLFCVTVTPFSLHQLPGWPQWAKQCRHVTAHSDWPFAAFPKPEFPLSIPLPLTFPSFIFLWIFVVWAFYSITQRAAQDFLLPPGYFARLVVVLFSSVGSLCFSFPVHTWEAVPPVLIHSWGKHPVCSSAHLRCLRKNMWVQVGHPAGRAATRWQFKRDLWSALRKLFTGCGLGVRK